MKLFNVGVLELLFILLLAFIVLGPEKAIEAAKDAARWISKMKKSKFWNELVTTSKEIQEIPQKLMDEVNLQNTIDDLDRSLVDTKNKIDETQLTINQQINRDKNNISRQNQKSDDIGEK